MKRTQRRVGATNRIIGSAILMLAGILFVALGIVKEEHLLLSFGLIITLAGILTGIVTLITGSQHRNE